MLVNCELLQRLALDARYNPRDQPALQAHLDDGYQRTVLRKGSVGSVQVAGLRHRTLHRLDLSATTVPQPRRLPPSIYAPLVRTPASPALSNGLIENTKPTTKPVYRVFTAWQAATRKVVT